MPGISLCGLFGFWLLAAPQLLADSWEWPTSPTTNRSSNGAYEFIITPPAGTEASIRFSQGSTAVFRRMGFEAWETLWSGRLINRVTPVGVLVPDTGRYVVTLDEWHSVGKNPVVIYGEGGRLIANLSLADLDLVDHPKISRSVSSYHWNAWAIFLFGPSPQKWRVKPPMLPTSADLPDKTPSGPAPPEPWRRLLEDSLFIRLYWGDLITIDLATGKVRNDGWWKTLPPADAQALKWASADYLDKTWRRLAAEYFRPENFDPRPTGDGIQGILLSGQFKLKEAVPLLRKIAADEQFRQWSAPAWETGNQQNVKHLAEVALEKIVNEK